MVLVRIWRKGNPHSLLVGIWTGTDNMESNMEVPQKTKNGIAIWSSKPVFKYIAKANAITISKRYLHFHVHCNIIHTRQDWKQVVSFKGQKKMWPIFISTYNSSLSLSLTKALSLFSHNKEVNLLFMTTEMHLKDIMLSELSQTEKDISCIISCMCGI